MTRLSTSHPPFVVRVEEEEHQELLHDLEALVEPGSPYPAAAVTCTRPSLLRRLAAMVARRMPPDTDRIVADVHDTMLTTAVSLHAGVPFALITDEGDVMGELHPGERMLLLSYCWNDAAAKLRESLPDRGLLEHCVVTVYADPGALNGANTTVLIPDPLSDRR